APFPDIRPSARFNEPARTTRGIRRFRADPALRVAINGRHNDTPHSAYSVDRERARHHRCRLRDCPVRDRLNRGSHEAYIYGYRLVTMELIRRSFTNVRRRTARAPPWGISSMSRNTRTRATSG